MMAIKRSGQNLMSASSLSESMETASTDEKVEISLRPKKLTDYIGQQEVKMNLAYLIEAAQIRKEGLDHILLYGPPGLGKTTLANIIGNEVGANVRITSGPALEKQGDIASIITNLKAGDILFIDEIHRLKPAVEEILYSAMEDFAIDLVIGKGPAAKTMRLKLPKFTLIGATTKVSMLSSPLRDRFGAVYKLNFYGEEDIAEILKRSAAILGLKIEDRAAIRLAKSSRQTPRIANRLLKRVRDFAMVKGYNEILLKQVEEGLAALGIDHLGLDDGDRTVLSTIIEKFKGGPVGVSTVSAATSEDEATIEDVYEPFLLQLGFLERTSRGRMVTEKGYDHLGFIYEKK